MTLCKRSAVYKQLAGVALRKCKQKMLNLLGLKLCFQRRIDDFFAEFRASQLVEPVSDERQCVGRRKSTIGTKRRPRFINDGCRHGLAALCLRLQNTELLLFGVKANPRTSSPRINIDPVSFQRRRQIPSLYPVSSAT